LIASAEAAINELGWKPKYDTVKEIIESAWVWHQANPKGYMD
jgi:UDP-glucose 4-epimerase